MSNLVAMADLNVVIHSQEVLQMRMSSTYTATMLKVLSLLVASWARNVQS
jgi:hypothetical protein